jgi:hypothetical protein
LANEIMTLLRHSPNYANQQAKSKLLNSEQIKELNGGAGEVRTPDLRFRNLMEIPHPVCFQSIQFGHSPALSGLVGRRTCNAICNALSEPIGFLTSGKTTGVANGLVVIYCA